MSYHFYPCETRENDGATRFSTIEQRMIHRTIDDKRGRRDASVTAPAAVPRELAFLPPPRVFTEITARDNESCCRHDRSDNVHVVER